MATDPTARRDAGLRRVSRMTRAGIVGGLAATGVFAALAAHGFAGTKAQPATTATAASAPKTSTSIPPTSSVGASTSNTDAQLQAPPTTVRPSRRSGRVTSGGS